MTQTPPFNSVSELGEEQAMGPMCRSNLPLIEVIPAKGDSTGQ